MKRNIIHSWDLDILVVRISSELSTLIKEKLFDKFDSISGCVSYIQSTLNYPSHTLSNFISWCIDGNVSRKNNIQFPIPIKFLQSLCKVLAIPLNFVDKNLLLIKPYWSKLLILNPNFPIKVNPISTSLFFHFYGDGSQENWCQDIKKHALNRERFLKKIEFTLGKITNWSSIKYREIYVPRILYQIFSKLFNVPIILDKNVIPSISTLSKNCLTSALLSIIMDEGHISKTHYEIRITQKSKKLIMLFYKICKLLNYEVSNAPKRIDKYYYLKITFFGVIKFYSDLNKIIDKYGEILDLGDKQDELENLIQRIKNKLIEINCRNSKGYHSSIVERDIKILRFLKDNNSTRREIENKLKLSFEEAHKRLGALKQNSLIKVIGFKDRAYIYQVTNKGKNLLKTWKSKSEKDFLLRQQTIEYCSKLNTNSLSVKNICNLISGLHVKKFYQLWKNKKEFKNDL